MNIEETLSKHPIIPVLTEDNPEVAIQVVGALLEGGIQCVELALRTPNALNVLESLCSQFSEACVGAGTLRFADDFGRVQRAGAQFAVSPGVSTELLAEAKNWDLAYLPAASTVTEILQLTNAGYSIVKLFPAEQLGGVAYVKSISAPLPDVNFVPSGGVNQQTALQYLSLDCINTVSGSWMIPASLVKDKDWKGIVRLTEEAARLSNKH